MSSSNQQKPQSAGDVEHTQRLPRAEKSSASRSSTGASPASRSVAGSATKTTEPGQTSGTAQKKAPQKAPVKKAPAKKASASSSNGQPTTVGEKLAADAAAKSASATSSAEATPEQKPAEQKPTGQKSDSSSPAAAKAADAGAAAGGAGTAAKKAPKKAPQKTPSAAGPKADATPTAPPRRTGAPSGSKEAPMTARDYARTTGGGVDSTSVIPAVRDEPTAEPAPAAAQSAVAGRSARLRLVHVEPWSVTRLAFVVSVALMIVAVVAVSIFWIVLDLAGVWDSLNGTITNVLSDGETGFDLTDYLGLGRLIGLTLLLSAINVIVMTMFATIAAHLYNLAAQLIGGVDVTFSDK